MALLEPDHPRTEDYDDLCQPETASLEFKLREIACTGRKRRSISVVKRLLAAAATVGYLRDRRANQRNVTGDLFRPPDHGRYEDSSTDSRRDRRVLSPSNGVSASSKAALYADHGVPEYWIATGIESNLSMCLPNAGADAPGPPSTECQSKIDPVTPSQDASLIAAKSADHRG